MLGFCEEIQSASLDEVVELVPCVDVGRACVRDAMFPMCVGADRRLFVAVERADGRTLTGDGRLFRDGVEAGWTICDWVFVLGTQIQDRSKRRLELLGGCEKQANRAAL